MGEIDKALDKVAALKADFPVLVGVYKASKEVLKAIKFAEKSTTAGELQSTNPLLLEADKVIRMYRELFGPFGRRSENDWQEAAGANVFNITEMQHAIEVLRGQQKTTSDFRDAFEALSLAYWGLRAQAVAPLLKNAYKAWIPSLGAIEQVHFQNVIRGFEGLAKTCGQIEATLGRTIALDAQALQQMKTVRDAYNRGEFR